jgi:hypothetical protein
LSPPDNRRLPPRRRPWRVFISHTSDLAERAKDRSFVRAAEATLIRAGHAVTDMQYFAARDTEPAQYCVDLVGDADVYLGIIGMRYGSPVRDRPDLSYTELEFETATTLGIPRLVFLLRDGAMVPVPSQPPERRLRQDAFRRRLQEQAGVTVGWITSPADLERELVRALADLERNAQDIPQPPEPRAGIPPDPAAHFTGREAELTELADKLCCPPGIGASAWTRRLTPCGGGRFAGTRAFGRPQPRPERRRCHCCCHESMGELDEQRDARLEALRRYLDGVLGSPGQVPPDGRSIGRDRRP